MHVPRLKILPDLLRAPISLLRYLNFSCQALVFRRRIKSLKVKLNLHRLLIFDLVTFS